jgi:outer membrane murein-binding lipoprotein Lpp
MKKTIATALSVTITLAGCATASRDIASNYTSPMQFQSYDCNQLSSEMQRIQSKVNQLGGRLDEAASNDKAIMGVGLILFWPALFALGGTKQQEAEYSRLKGEYDAVQQSAVAKKCPGAVTTIEVNNQPTDSQSSSTSAASPVQSHEAKLKELKRLNDAGLISAEVYLAQQKAILVNP